MRICCHYCFCRDLHGLEHRTVLFMFFIAFIHIPFTSYTAIMATSLQSLLVFIILFVRQAEASPFLACSFNGRKKGSKKQILHASSMDGPCRPYKEILASFFSLHIDKSNFCQVPTSSLLLPYL
jgi:hypothetical protein